MMPDHFNSIDVQVAETGSGLFPGIALDNLHLTVSGTATIMAVVAAIMRGIWSLLYLLQQRSAQIGAYAPLEEQDAELAAFGQRESSEHVL